MKVAIDGTVQEAKTDELLIDLINRTGGSVPLVCYHPQLGPVQTCDTCMVGVNGRLARACETPITDGIQPSEYSSALSLLSLAVNCCDVTLGDMLTFKLVLGGKLRIRKSQLQTQLGFAEYW